MLRPYIEIEKRVNLGSGLHCQLRQQRLGSLRHLGYGFFKRGLVGAGGRAVATDFAHVLQSGGLNFFRRYGTIKFPQSFDASAHGSPTAELPQTKTR